MGYMKELIDNNEDLANQFLVALFESSLVKLSKMNSGLARLEKGEALAARNSLGIMRIGHTQTIQQVQSEGLLRV